MKRTGYVAARAGPVSTILLSSFLGGCEAPPEPASPSPSRIPRLMASGDVVGPLGLHRSDAVVSLVRIDPRTGAEVSVAETTNSTTTGFRLVSGYVGRHRLEVRAPRCRTVAIPIDVPPEGARFEQRLRPAAAATTALVGELRDVDGGALDSGDVALLVGLPAFVTAWHDGDGVRMHEARTPIDDPARFSFDVPVGFDGAVELRSGGTLLASARWRSGDGDVRLGVDPQDLRRRVGAIDVLADRRVRVAVVRVGDPARFPGLEPVAEVDGAAGRATFGGRWPGRYLVVATPEGEVPVVARVEVEPGRTVTVAVEPIARAERRVRLVGLVPSELEGFVGEVEVGTREGAPLPVRLGRASDASVITVEGASGGEAILRARGQAFRVAFDEGNEDELMWHIGPIHRAWIPVTLVRSLHAPRPESVATRVRLESRDGLLVDERWSDVELDAQGNGLAPVPFTPGRYLLRVDVPAAERYVIEDVVLYPTDHDHVLLFGDGDRD